jgi:hypothetical protein
VRGTEPACLTQATVRSVIPNRRATAGALLHTDVARPGDLAPLARSRLGCAWRIPPACSRPDRSQSSPGALLSGNARSRCPSALSPGLPANRLPGYPGSRLPSSSARRQHFGSRLAGHCDRAQCALRDVRFMLSPIGLCPATTGRESFMAPSLRRIGIRHLRLAPCPARVLADR